jgi:hypothetical protein
VRTCPQITQINADTDKACFICVHLRVLRAKVFSLVPSVFALALPRKRSGLKFFRGHDAALFNLFAYFEYFAVKTPKSLQFKPLGRFCLKSERFLNNSLKYLLTK